MSTSASVGLGPVSTVLTNGVRVLAKHAETTPAATVSLALPAGSAYDPDGKLGVAYFLSRVVDRGTGLRTAETIAEDLDLRGVSLRVAVTRQTLTLECDCLSEDFDAVLALLADIARDPTCLDDEVETRRSEVLTTIRQDEDNPATMAMEQLMGLLYGPTHPYGRPTKGTAASVAGIDRDTLLGFHRQRFVPSGVSLVVVGDVAPAHVAEAADAALGAWVNDAGLLGDPPPQTPASTRRRSVVVSMMSKSQADIGYGFTTVTRTDPSYYAHWLLANVFGQYGMGGRLGQNIRERRGLAYYAFCAFEAGRIPGPLIVRAGVSGANVDTTLSLIDDEVSALAAEGVSETELADSKRYLIGSMPRRLETNAGIAAFLQEVQRFDLGLDYDLRIRNRIEAVTRDDVNEAAHRILRPEQAAVVVAGPYQDRSHVQACRPRPFSSTSISR